MTREGQVREVYAYFGLAVYLGQVLEHGIVNAMVIMRLSSRSAITNFDIDAFMDGQFEKTLGTLIKNLRSEMALPVDLDGLLKRALNRLNWLCHDYFRERAVEMMTENGREKMLAELADARELLIHADSCLTELVRPIAERNGITEAALKAELQKICPDERNSAD